MRKLVMLTTALIGLAYADLAYAQSNQSGPQPGLPPGASIGAPNALQPRPTGQIATTPTGPAMSAPEPYNPPPAHVSRHRARHHRAATHHRRMRHHHRMAPATASDAAPATAQ